MKLTSKSTHLWAAGLLILTVFLAYADSFHGAFQFDDMYYIVNNAAISHPRDIAGLWKLTGQPVRFLPFLTFAFNYAVGGYHVFGYHLVNFLIHLANVFLVYGLTLLLFRTPRLRHLALAKEKASTALTAALLFGAHPLMTQAVTYISQRFASMATFFYLGAVCLYLRGRLSSGNNRVFSFVLCAAAMVCGMLTKQITITISLMLVVTEMLFFDSKRKYNFRYALYFLPLVLLIPLMYHFQAGFITTANVPSGNFPGDRLNWQTYALTQPRVILTYLRLFFIPLGQRLDYLFPASHAFLEPKTLAAFLFIASTLIGAFVARRRYPLAAFGVFWFYIALLVESSIIVIKHVIFEHRAYLPSVGLALIAAVWLHAVFRSRYKRHAAVTLLVACLAFLSFKRNAVWQSDFTLWQDNLKKEPKKARPYISLGIAYIRVRKYDKAIEFLNKAIALDPTQLKAFHNRALAYQEEGKYDAALADYGQALQLDGSKEVVYTNRGSLYRILGKKRQAFADYNAAIRENPSYAQAYVNRGVSLGEEGRYSQALQDFNRAIALDPNLSEAFNNRGIIYQENGHFSKSKADFNRALALNPHYAEAFYNRGNTYKALKDFPAALADYARAIKLNPHYKEAYNNQGIVLGMVNRIPAALASFDKAIAADPNFAESYFNRSLAQARLGKYQAALKDLDRAEALGKTVNTVYREQLNTKLKGTHPFTTKNND